MLTIAVAEPIGASSVIAQATDDAHPLSSGVAASPSPQVVTDSSSLISGNVAGERSICCLWLYLYPRCVHVCVRVATNLENLEFSGISLNMENSEFSGNSVQPQGKIVTNSSLFKYLCKTAIDWVNGISGILGSSDPAQ